MLASLARAARVAPLVRASAPAVRSLGTSAGAGAAPSSFGSQFYQIVFKRNSTYAVYIFGGAIVLEALTGTVFDGFFRAVNHGRMYDSIDWATRFPASDD